MAVRLRDANKLNLVVVLAFSLSAAPSLPITDRRTIEAAFDWSPPSLYLFDREPWTQPGFVRIEAVDPSVLGEIESSASAHLVEFRNGETDEVYWSLYVAA